MDMLEMLDDYKAGYASAVNIEINVLHPEATIETIDMFKQKAVDHCNSFFAGLAQGVWDNLLDSNLTNGLDTKAKVDDQNVKYRRIS